MRFLSVIGLLLGAGTLASCASTSAFVADNLPEWAGGLPKDAPPRLGSPGYDAYLRGISGDQAGATAPPTAQSTAQPASPSRDPKEPVNQPIPLRSRLTSPERP